MLLEIEMVEVSFGTSFPINFLSSFRVHKREPAFFYNHNPSPPPHFHPLLISPDGYASNEGALTEFCPYLLEIF
jgi:hypothetical protein